MEKKLSFASAFKCLLLPSTLTMFAHPSETFVVMVSSAKNCFRFPTGYSLSLLGPCTIGFLISGFSIGNHDNYGLQGSTIF